MTKGTLLLLGLMIGGALPAFSSNLLSNSDFQQGIQGWTIQGDQARVRVEDEGGHRFLRLELDQPGFLVVSQQFPVGADWKGLRVHGRARVEGLKKGPEGHNTATFLYGFDDAKGQHVGPWFQTMLQQDQPWTDFQAQVTEIPEGAAKLTVQAAFMNAAGRADFANLSVEPVIKGELPAGVVQAGGEAVEDLGFGRGRICLNGVWQFQPAQGAAVSAPLSNAWGLIRVPGTWSPRAYAHEAALVPPLVDVGTGPTWKGWDGANVSQGWYERSLEVPKEWAGREIVLDLTRVSTSAKVLVDGQLAGEVSWPGGRVILTPQVKPGSTQKLQVLVSAAHDKSDTVQAMGFGQNTLVEAKLASRGLTGEVFLVSHPKGPRIEGVWVRTSVRKKELVVDADMTGVKKNAPVTLKAEIRDGAGKLVKTFHSEGRVEAGASTLSATWSWADPKLWDVGQPHLYTLDLSVQGEGINAGFRQTFGFREVWIEGRTVFLNGTPFRLRPINISSLLANPEVLESQFKNILNAGFNIAEIWPGDFTERGSMEFSNLISEVADRVGLPLMGQTRSAISLFHGWVGLRWDNPQAREEWTRLMKNEWRTFRNHPSIIIWASSGNIAGQTNDQAPRFLGRGVNAPAWKNSLGTDALNRTAKLEEVVKTVKDIDSTRPYMYHQGALAGDIYSVNNYLCLIPLQEREEWLSDWAEHGDRPFCSIEFGTPLSTTFYRGRDGFINSMPTEPLATEFMAAYLGQEAYALERPAYRETIVSKYEKEQKWQWPDNSFMNFEPNVQKLEELFIRNTWRSWRTMGITGGMVPWSSGHGFEDLGESVKAPPFRAGARGIYTPLIQKDWLNPFGGPGVNVLPAGQALIANNSPTLAWIAGAAIAGDNAAFTAKDHAFRQGEVIQKQIALLNDTRTAQPWSFTITATLHDKPLGSPVTKSGTLAVGETLLVPVEFPLPAQVPSKESGTLRLEAKIGDAQHTDHFDFRVFSAPPPLSGHVAVFDPEGTTRQLLEYLGLKVTPWDGKQVPALVVGRRALSSGTRPPASLEAYVKNGGRLLVMTQDPTWVEDFLGLRISHIMSRRFFRMDATHPVVEGLDDLDLRDWRGSSTLLDPKPDEGGDSRNMTSTWGWRWGARGVVASLALEKPHRAGWRPLLEGEFDLAYTPLMELDFGKGRVVFTTLDLEDHANFDPAAERLARNLLNYVLTAPLATPRVEALYVGNDEGEHLLKLLGVQYHRDSQINPSAALVILGPDVSADAALPVLAKGGRVFALPRTQTGSAGLGLEVIEKSRFGGSLSVPDWAETRGISAANLRRRVDSPALVLQGSGTAAEGLLARIEQGPGVAIFAQTNPMTTPADEKQYLRFTRWNETRVLTQILANLGARFAMDRHFFEGGTSRVKLDGEWKVEWTRMMPSSSAAFPDPGMSEKAALLVKAGAEESGMKQVMLPAYWKDMESADGEAVFRRTFRVPPEMLGKPLTLHLGRVDDFDATFINGVQVGATDATVPEHHTVERRYPIPANLLKAGENVIAVRVFDNFGGGGLAGGGGGMAIQPEGVEDFGFYHPDYRSDFKLGDDPYRYYRW